MRKSLVKIHLWLGLILGLFWAVQGLTGAMLVFHREMDRAASPAVVSGPMISLDRIVATGDGRGPVTMVGIADGRGDLLNLHYKADGGVRQLRVEAATGRIVGERDHDPSTPLGGAGWRWIYLLHESLLLHDRGETMIGISGLFLFSALLTGLAIGWPRRSRLKNAFAWGRWRSTGARLFGWHRMVGLLAGALLLLTIPGGIWMIFAAELRPALADAVPHQLPFKPSPAERLGPVVKPQAALDRARALFPDSAFVRLTLPTAAAPVYAIRLRQADEVRAWSGVTMVTIDAATGRLLHVYDPLTAPLSNKLADGAFSVHSGEIAGTLGRLALFFAGLSLPGLYVTGCWQWWRKRRSRRGNSRDEVARAVLQAEAPAR